VKSELDLQNETKSTNYLMQSQWNFYTCVAHRAQWLYVCCLCFDQITMRRLE